MKLLQLIVAVAGLAFASADINADRDSSIVALERRTQSTIPGGVKPLTRANTRTGGGSPVRSGRAGPRSPAKIKPMKKATTPKIKMMRRDFLEDEVDVAMEKRAPNPVEAAPAVRRSTEEEAQPILIKRGRTPKRKFGRGGMGRQRRRRRRS